MRKSSALAHVSASKAQSLKVYALFVAFEKKIRFLEPQFHVLDNKRWAYLVLSDLMFTFMSFVNKIQSPKYKPEIMKYKKTWSAAFSAVLVLLFTLTLLCLDTRKVYLYPNVRLFRCTKVYIGPRNASWSFTSV